MIAVDLYVYPGLTWKGGKGGDYEKYMNVTHKPILIIHTGQLAVAQRAQKGGSTK